MAPSAVDNGHAVSEANSSEIHKQSISKSENTEAKTSESVVVANGSSSSDAVSLVNSKSEEGEEVTKVGMECDLKNLYQKEDDRGRHTWTEKYPDDLDEAAENEITARYAILVRNKKSFDSRKKLEIDSIVVQSPLIKNVLKKVLKDYPGKSISRKL